MFVKIFSQIFDSSIADDVNLRHFFMDLLVLADQDGVVDMTPTAIAAKTRIPLAEVRLLLTKLEQPDPESRTPEHEGRRIFRLDEHRTWGWGIVNYGRFRETAKDQQRRAKSREASERFKTKNGNLQLLDNQARNSRNASASASASASDLSTDGKNEPFQKPTLELVKQRAIKIGLPPNEAEKFFDYYESNGWRVGKNKMKMWSAALANWKRHWIEFSGGRNGRTPGQARNACQPSQQGAYDGIGKI